MVAVRQIRQDDRCSRCNHPRSWHTDRYVRDGPAGCPLPCECVQFVEPEPPRLDAATPAIHTAPVQADGGISEAMRAFGPGTTAGGRAEAGWLPAGRIVGEGPEILRDLPEGWEPGWGDFWP